MNDNDRVRLGHMLEAAEEALEFAQGRTRENLDTNRMLSLALIKDIEIIGEAASKISKDFRDSVSQIPWPVIIGMRNRLIHAYFDIDVDLLWDTITNDLPPLIVELKKLMPSEEN